MTIEEEVIAKMLPMNNQVDLSEAEFKPVLGDTHDAEKTLNILDIKMFSKIINEKLQNVNPEACIIKFIFYNLIKK